MRSGCAGSWALCPSLVALSVLLSCGDGGKAPVSPSGGSGATTPQGGNGSGGTPASGGSANDGATGSAATGGSGGGGTIPSSGGGGSETGGGGPSGGAPGSGGSPGTSCALVPTETGWIQADTNDCGIQGAWYYYDDCSTSPASCTAHTLPAPGTEGFANTGGSMCTAGVIAPVTTEAEYSTKWGAGIALNLNQPVDSETKNPIATLPVAVKGFSFTVSGSQVPAEIRVTFPTPTTPDTSHFKPITTGAGNYEVLFADARQGSWVATPSDLDATQVTAIQFQVPSKMGAEVPFDFCISELKGLY